LPFSQARQKARPDPIIDPIILIYVYFAKFGIKLDRPDVLNNRRMTASGRFLAAVFKVRPVESALHDGRSKSGVDG
jgi:hypothetical protein